MEYGWNFSISGLKWCWKVVEKKYLWNFSMGLPFSIKWIYLIERRNFDQKYKFSNKNDMVSAWRNFKNIFSRPLFTIIFRPEMLKFHPYSILTGDTMVGFVIFCVLRKGLQNCSTREHFYCAIWYCNQSYDKKLNTQPLHNFKFCKNSFCNRK